MSSFVIGKKEYVAFCGFLAGLHDCKDNWIDPMRIWHYGKGAVYDENDFLLSAYWLYHLNAESVKLQYHDDAAATDSNKYLDVFSSCRKSARRIYMTDKATMKLKIYDALNFIHSARYQTEDEECSGKMNGFLYRVEDCLFCALRRIDTVRDGVDYDRSGTWGEFTI